MTLRIKYFIYRYIIVLVVYSYFLQKLNVFIFITLNKNIQHLNFNNFYYIIENNKH